MRSRPRGKSMPSGNSLLTLSPRFSPKSSTLAYPHVSTYRSGQMQLELYSQRIKTSRANKKRPSAVFNNHDQVGGKVILDRSCHHTGRLSVSIEGAFNYYHTSIHAEGDAVPELFTPKRRRHIFFSSSTVIPVSPGANPPSRSALRNAFIRHRPHASSHNLNATPMDRHFSFVFQLPQSCRPGEEMPPSFSSPQVSGSMSNAFDVSYQIKVVWEARDAMDVPLVLEVPILFYPGHNFQTVDTSSQHPQSWLEMPLKSDRPMTFRCVITLPTSVTFSRPSSIPYFVVFTTIPRSPALAQEIATDATISVSLLRQINVTKQAVSLPTPPTTPSSVSEESDVLRNKLLKCVRLGGQSVAKAVKILEETPRLQDKPLPPLPNETFTETTTLQNSICIGFPKRPRLLFDGRGHPSLENYAALPDGLHKNKILVPKDILPCIDWAGLSVKYYLDVSVLVGLDDFRARVPVRII